MRRSRFVRLAAALGRALVYTLAIVLVVVGAAVAGVETGWGKNQIRQLIVRQANQYLTATLEIGRIEGSLFRGIELADIRLSRDGETLVSIDNVSLGYSVRELFEAGVVIRRISLTRPHVVAAKQPDGRWNLGAIVKRDTTRNRRSGPGRPIQILSIEIVDGAVELRDPLTFGAARVPSRFDHLDANFSLDYVPVSWTFDFTRASWKGALQELSVNSLSGTISTGSDGWAFTNLAVATPHSAFTLDGLVDRRIAPTELDLTVDAERFAFQEWSPVLSGLKNLAIVGRFNTHLQGPLAKLATDLDMQTNGGAVRGSIVLNTTVPGWHGKGDIAVQRLNLAHWFNRADRPSDITGRVRFDLDLRLGRWPIGTYVFNGPHARFMDYEADNMTARGDITPNDVRIAQATADAYGSRVSLSSGTIGIADPYPFRFVGTATGVDLRQVPATVPVPHVDSTLAFDYDVTGRFTMPFVAGHARFDNSEFLGAQVGAGAVGSIDTSAQPYKYAGEGDVTGINLHRFGAELQVGWLQQPRYAGTVSGHFHVDGAGSEPATMTLTGGGHLARADVFQGRLFDADVSIDIANGSLSGTYAGGLAAIDAAMAMDDPRFDASLSGVARARMTVRDLMLRTPALDDYLVDGALTLESSVVRRIPVDRGEIVATLENETLDIGRMNLSGAALEMNGSGTIELDATRSSKFDYEITRADLARLKDVTGQDASGVVTTTGQLTGPTTALHLAGTGVLTELEAAGAKALTTQATYDAVVPADAPEHATIKLDGRTEFVEAFGQQINSTVGVVTYDDGRATVDLEVQQSNQIAGRILGAFVVHQQERAIDLTSLSLAFRRATWQLAPDDRARVSWDDESVTVGAVRFADATGGQQLAVDGTWRTDGRGALKIVANRVFLDTFAPPSAEPVRYGGVLDLDGTLTGTREHPLLTGRFTITDGRIRRLSYEKLGGEIHYADAALQVDVRLDQAPGVWLTATGTLPLATFDRTRPERAIDVALRSSPISLTLIEGVTDVVRNVTGDLRLDVRLIGTSRDPHFDGTVDVADAGFTVTSSGARYKNARASLRLAPDRVTVDVLHIEDREGHPLDVQGSLATHELTVGELAIDARTRQFEVLRNEFGRVSVDAQLSLRGRFEAPRLNGSLTVTGGELAVDAILDRTLFQPYSTSEVAVPRGDVDAIAALNPWNRLGLNLELHVPNTLRMVGDNVQITPGTPLGLGNINLRVLGDLFLYKDPGQPLYVNGSFDQVTGTYVFQGRRFDLDPVSSINFRGDLNPDLFVTVTRLISGVETRVTIAGTLQQPELRLASAPPLDPSDILSLIVFNTSTNELSALQQRDLAVRAGTLAAGFISAPLLTAVERSLGISTIEIETGADIRTGPRVTIGDEIAPGLVARFSRQFGEDVYNEVTVEYYLSRILRLRATFSDAAAIIARSPFRRVERAGIDLLLFFSF